MGYQENNKNFTEAIVDNDIDVEVGKSLSGELPKFRIIKDTETIP